MVVDNKIDDVKKVLSQFQPMQQFRSPQQLQQQLQPVQQLQHASIVTHCHERCCCKKCLKLIAATDSSRRMTNINGHIPSPISENNADAPPLKTSENIINHILHENVECGVTETCDDSGSQNCEINAEVPSQTYEINSHISLCSAESTDDCVSLPTFGNVDHFSSETSVSWNCEENNENISSWKCENDGRIPSQNCSVESNNSAQVATQESFSTFAENNGHIPSAICQSDNKISAHIPLLSCPNGNHTEAQIPSATSPSEAHISPLQLHVVGCSDVNADVPLLQRDLSVTTATITGSSGAGDTNVDVPLSSSNRIGSKCHPLCSCHRCLQLVSSVNYASLLHSTTERGLSGEF